MTWWTDPAARLERRLANRRAAAEVSGSRARRPGLVQIRVQIDAGNLERRFRAMPGKLQRSIRRRALRKSLSVIAGLLKADLMKHRSKVRRIHLADSVQVVTRNYRKSRSKGSFVMWGGVGIRFGGAPLKGMAKAGSTGAKSAYAGFLPGWRWHFLEKGHTNRKAGRRYEGRNYIERNAAAARFLVADTFRATMNNLVRAGG